MHDYEEISVIDGCTIRLTLEQAHERVMATLEWEINQRYSEIDSLRMQRDHAAEYFAGAIAERNANKPATVSLQPPQPEEDEDDEIPF